LIFNILSFLPIIGLIATIVYMVDVRPALRGISGGGRKYGGSSSDGPYGPYNGGREQAPHRPHGPPAAEAGAGAGGSRRPPAGRPGASCPGPSGPGPSGPGPGRAGSARAVQEQHGHVVRQLAAVEVPHLVDGGPQQFLAAQ